ncbi:hypothetical protein DCAR_0518456 [Daucus carota subsp. sativus]|uniref:Uncharacterized protein n=1 Tax=Daucus carota subsp. sativus TaxID=79200 RepID=A0A161YI42_DAUCS|nr:hypothetical protein DCAR_0518456 [Daucus carota subsp. sativus]
MILRNSASTLFCGQNPATSPSLLSFFSFVHPFLLSSLSPPSQLSILVSPSLQFSPPLSLATVSPPLKVVTFRFSELHTQTIPVNAFYTAPNKKLSSPFFLRRHYNSSETTSAAGHRSRGDVSLLRPPPVVNTLRPQLTSPLQSIRN